MRANASFQAATRATHVIPGGRNARSVWTIASEAFPDAHFATFPTALVEPCIKAGCPAGGTVLDPFLGAGTTALVAREHAVNLAESIFERFQADSDADQPVGDPGGGARLRHLGGIGLRLGLGVRAVFDGLVVIGRLQLHADRLAAHLQRHIQLAANARERAKTTSPGLLHRSTQRRMTVSCNGLM